MSTLRTCLSWIGGAFLFVAAIVSVILTWAGLLVSIALPVVWIVKAFGVVVPWSWGTLLVGFVAALVVWKTGKMIAESITGGADDDAVPPTADLSSRRYAPSRSVSHAPRSSGSPRPAAATDDALLEVAYFDMVAHHHHHPGTSDYGGHHDTSDYGGGESSCGGGSGD